ncbi:MAG TPA: C45 family autoproteolytic acyltransferase/hydrolase [Dermatophilaceae bacterium]|nr:C45 family autoproteolytic acyltransferase/hydrolase [Dermatophilaceae bacterium]
MRVHEYDSGPTLAPQRGEAVGRRYNREIGLASGAYRSWFRDRGLTDARIDELATSAFEAVAGWSPKLSDEIAHTARGAGIGIPELTTLVARSEVIAALPEPGYAAPAPEVDPDDDPLSETILSLRPTECTTVVWVPPTGMGHVLSLQTWDWASWLAPNGVLARYALNAKGDWIKTFAEPGQLAKIGLSSRGISVHLNMLHHESDTGEGGVPVHALLRRILEDAGSVSDAVDIVRAATVSASAAITVVANVPGQVGAVTLEVSPAGVAEVKPDADGWLVHTNHFLDEGLAAGQVVDPTSTTVERYDYARSVLDPSLPAKNLLGVSQALVGEQGADAPICAKENTALPMAERSSTLLTVKLHPGIGFVEYLPGSPADVVAMGGARRF